LSHPAPGFLGNVFEKSPPGEEPCIDGEG